MGHWLAGVIEHATPLDAACNALKDRWRPKALAVISGRPFSAFGLGWCCMTASVVLQSKAGQGYKDQVQWTVFKKSKKKRKRKRKLPWTPMVSGNIH